SSTSATRNGRCPMSAFSSPDVRRNAWLLVLVSVILLAHGADARTRVRARTARLDVVSDKGDTITIQRPVKGVTISGEGIRIQGGPAVTGPGTVVSAPGFPAVPEPDVDVHIDFDDSSLKALGYGHHGSGDIV